MSDFNDIDGRVWHVLERFLSTPSGYVWRRCGGRFSLSGTSRTEYATCLLCLGSEHPYRSFKAVGYGVTTRRETHE